MSFTFGTREGVLRYKEVTKLDLNEIIRTNNLGPVERFAENLTFCNVDNDDNIKKPELKKLIKAFQFGLEFLNNRQVDLENTNTVVENNYYKLRNDSFAIEEKLKRNKLLIKKYTKEKREREMLLVTYKSIIEFNTNESNEEVIRKVLQKKSGETFYCHICSGKPFSTEEKLESHMKRRHLNMAGVLDTENEESYAQYNKKIDVLKNELETMLKDQEAQEMKRKCDEELRRIRQENEKKIKAMEERFKSILSNFKDFILNAPRPAPQPITIASNTNNDELIKITKSIIDMNNLISAQYDSRLNAMMKEINDIKKNTIGSNFYQPSQNTITNTEKRYEREVIKQEVAKPSAEHHERGSPISSDLSIKRDRYNFRDGKKILDDDDDETKKIGGNRSRIETNSNIPITESRHFINISGVDNLGRSRNAGITEISSSFLPNAPNLSRTQKLPTFARKKFKPIVIKEKLSKTMTDQDKLEIFFAKFMNRDNAIFDEEEPKPSHYLNVIVPDDEIQDEDVLKKTLSKSIINTEKIIQISDEDFENKTKRELINIIDLTLKNIDEVNKKSQVSQLYFDTVQKAIDWKIYEAEKEDIKRKMEEENEDKKSVGSGMIKRVRTKSSKASEVIRKANDL